MKGTYVQWVTPVLVAIALATSTALFSAFLSVHQLEHDILEMDLKLDKKVFTTYKESNDVRNVLVIKLLKKDINYIDKRMENLNIKHKTDLIKLSHYQEELRIIQSRNTE